MSEHLRAEERSLRNPKHRPLWDDELLMAFCEEFRQNDDKIEQLELELEEAMELLKEAAVLIDYDKHSACVRSAIDEYLERTSNE